MRNIIPKINTPMNPGIQNKDPIIPLSFSPSNGESELKIILMPIIKKIREVIVSDNVIIEKKPLIYFGISDFLI